MQSIALIGFDVHKIVKTCIVKEIVKKLNKKSNKKKDENINKNADGLYIGGVLVDEKTKFKAHSDGDILIHAIIDAISSYAIGKDIGQLFPDNINMYKNYPSEKLLEKTIELIGNNLNILSIDAVIIIDRIKIAPIKDKIIENLQKYFPQTKIIVKGKRTEGAFKKNFGYCWVICNVISMD